MQVWALLVDSYRLLLQRKLFWITLVISFVVVVIYGSIGFNDKGVSLFFGLTTWEEPNLAKGQPFAKVFYMTIFSVLIVGGWLTWIATILALISTTTIFTDFMSVGSVDMVLAKPIGRIKIFFAKYLGSLLFVLLQVALFCVGIFFCVALRLGEWDFKIFIAIPLVLVFYSYLYSFNVLMAMLTRSAIAAFLITILFWFMLWAIQVSEGQLLQFRTRSEFEVEMITERVKMHDKSLELMKTNGSGPTRIGEVKKQRDSANEELETAQGNLDQILQYHKASRWLLAVLPKNKETLGLLDRWLAKEDELTFIDLMFSLGNNKRGPAAAQDKRRDREFQKLKRMEESYQERTPWFIIGTSLAFEAVVLGLACFIFVRRDF